MNVKTVYVYDDQGVLASAKVADSENIIEAAILVVEELVEWTETELEDEGTDFCGDDLKTHQTELQNLISDIKGHAIDLTEHGWYETSMGFTFSSSEE